MGFGPPSRCYPKSPPQIFRSRAPLLGFRRPYNARGGESPRPAAVARFGLPGGARGFANKFPPCRLRCRSQVFPTSQRSSSSPHRPAIFRRVAFMGLRPSGNFLPRSLDDSSPPTCPPDVLPIELALIPVLGGDAVRARARAAGARVVGAESPFVVDHRVMPHGQAIREVPRLGCPRLTGKSLVEMHWHSAVSLRSSHQRPSEPGKRTNQLAGNEAIARP
jgi:hypothetical protein